jgi:hypothetical protein
VLLVGNSRDQLCSRLSWIGSEPLNKLDIPEMVQVVGGEPVRFRWRIQIG